MVISLLSQEITLDKSFIFKERRIIISDISPKKVLVLYLTTVAYLLELVQVVGYFF